MTLFLGMLGNAAFPPRIINKMGDQSGHSEERHRERESMFAYQLRYLVSKPNSINERRNVKKYLWRVLKHAK